LLTDLKEPEEANYQSQRKSLALRSKVTWSTGDRGIKVSGGGEKEDIQDLRRGPGGRDEKNQK